eukprot:2826271-Pyramimonas_sp.AAC.1
MLPHFPNTIGKRDGCAHTVFVATHVGVVTPRLPPVGLRACRTAARQSREVWCLAMRVRMLACSIAVVISIPALGILIPLIVL